MSVSKRRVRLVKITRKPQRDRFEVQVMAPLRGEDSAALDETGRKAPTEYRITHIKTDSRVATCYMEEHAKMVCAALNAYTGPVMPPWISEESE